MHTIWFRLPDTSGALHVVIGDGTDFSQEARWFALGYAREAWDRLFKAGFEMLSARP